MIIEYKDKKGEVRITLNTLRRLKEKYKDQVKSAGVNLAVTLVYGELFVGDPLVLLDVLCMVDFNGDKFTKNELEEWLNDINTDFEKENEAFLQLLETHSLTKRQATQAKKEIETEMAKIMK